MVPEWMLLMDMTPGEREAYEESRRLHASMEGRPYVRLEQEG